MSLLSSVKRDLRITHTSLDESITENILAAKAEMIRAGVNPALVAMEENNPLVLRAIKTFVRADMYGQDGDQGEKYMESFKYQVDNLRKSGERYEI